MNNEEVKNELVKLIRVFNGKRVVSEDEIKGVLTAIVKILAENKKAVDTLAEETKQTTEVMLAKASQTLTEETQSKIREVLLSLEADYNLYNDKLKKSAVLSRDDIQKAVKAQNERAFKRLQTLIDNIKLPQDGQPGINGLPGRDGKDGSPDTPEAIRNKLESLKDDERIDYTAIKGLPDYFKIAKKAGRQMLVGGIRFLESLADVSLPVSSRRQNMIIQYNATNNRHEAGIALTVGTTEPSSPQTGDVWIDTN